MKKVILGSAAVLGLSVLAFSAMAAPQGRPGGPGGFSRLDTNGDGKITAEEMSARQTKLIAAADKNGDGALTQEELKAYHEARRAEWKKKHSPDKNGDGVISKKEFAAASEARFARMDKNGDGVLSKDEMPKPRGHHDRRGGRGGPGAPDGPENE